MLSTLVTLGTYFALTTLYSWLSPDIQRNYFVEYIYLLISGILLLGAIYSSLKRLIRRLKNPPQPSQQETLLRSIGFALAFAIWAIYVDIHGIQLFADTFFWLFIYFFGEILYLRFRYPPPSTGSPHWIAILLSKRKVKFFVTTFLFLHVFLVNWYWWESQIKGFIGIFIFKDPLAWF